MVIWKQLLAQRIGGQDKKLPIILRKSVVSGARKNKAKMAPGVEAVANWLGVAALGLGNCCIGSGGNIVRHLRTEQTRVRSTKFLFTYK